MLNTPKKKKFNPMLMNVILISLGIHLVGLLILGGITVIKHVIPDEAQFEEPPAVAEEAPPPEVKVKIPPPQTPKPQSMSKLSMRPLTNIAVANVAVDLPSMDQSFTVSSGLGGIGGGSLVGGGGGGSIGMGMSDVSVFGLKARAEKILFIVDAGANMVYDDKGGLNSYRVIKQEISDMVANLSAGTLFNVMLFESNGPRSNIQLFRDSLKPAGVKIAADLATWLAPVNSSVNKVGISGRSPTVTIEVPGFEQYFAGMRAYPTDQAIAQFAMEMNVNAVFIITGQHAGFGKMRLELTEAQRASNDASQSSYSATAEYKAYKAEVPAMQKRLEQAVAAENKKRAAKGQPPKVLNTRLISAVQEMGLTWKNPPPGRTDIARPTADEGEVETYVKAFCKHHFQKNNREPPSINVVLFLAEDEELSKEDKAKVSKYVRYFRGKMKLIRGLAGISSSASAKGASN
jgi:hypothetical protein